MSWHTKHQQPRSSARHGRRPLLERLEPRTLLAGIVNGDFSIADELDPGFGWSETGSADVADGQGVLNEDANVFSDLAQTFEIDSGSTSLVFTITDLSLQDAGPLPDGLEVKLLDAATGTSLVGTAAGLSDTDALLNIQSSGEVFFGSDTIVPGVDNSGDVADLNAPVTVTVDLTAVPGGTVAELQFTLLGFAPYTSQVAVDNVSLIGIPWQNPRNRLDVNDDGFVTPIDALININRLNSQGPGPLPVPPIPPNVPPPYYDVSGDNFSAPLDVLIVINFLNQQSGGEGEVRRGPVPSPRTPSATGVGERPADAFYGTLEPSALQPKAVDMLLGMAPTGKRFWAWWDDFGIL